MLVPRLARTQAQGEEQQGRPIDPGTTVLITGGLSGLGALVARHLAEAHDVRHLLLVSRRGPEADGAAELAAELEELGAQARIAACDVSDRTQLEQLIDSIPSEHPLGAVVHAAAVLDDGVIESMSSEQIERVFAPKASAAWHLHELTEGMELTQFLMFSSVAGTLGGAAQANYAAANVFLDALAGYRQARGLPATSLAWGSWEMASDATGELEAAEAKRLAEQIRLRLGVAPVTPDRGLELFDEARALAEPLLLVGELDRSALRAQALGGTLPAILRGLVPLPARREQVAGSLIRRLAEVPEAERDAVVLDLVRTHAAAVLGHPSAQDVEPDRAFKELGFDSLAAVEMRNRLVAATGMQIPPTLVFDYPSVAAVAEHLLAETGLDGGGGADQSGEAAFRQGLARVPLARLRDAGLIEPLMELIHSDGEAGDLAAGDLIDQIDSMDVDDLVQRTDDLVRRASARLADEPEVGVER